VEQPQPRTTISPSPSHVLMLLYMAIHEPLTRR
jgi:hypothetical protein